MSFNRQDIATVEFGVCRGSLRNGESTMVPVDASVQALLRDMVEDTTNAMGLTTPDTVLERYGPSQEHSAASKLA